MMLRETNAVFVKAANPSAEQGSAFHLARIDAAGGGGEGFDAKASGPGTGRVSIKLREEIRPGIGRLLGTSVPRGELFARFGVSEIQAATTGDEKFPADGSFRVEDGDFRAARCGDFSGAQSSWPAADYGNVHE
jgi:hypothetical protein